MEYKFDKKVSENANGEYLMGMEIIPDKIAEDEKEKDNKNNNENKNIEKREKENVARKMVQKSTSTNYMKKWDIRKKKIQN